MLGPAWTKSTASGMNGCVTARFVKATASSSGNCVEVAFTTATASAQGNCVQVGHDADRILLRDSKLGQDSPVLSFTKAEWEAFLHGVKAGEFDLTDAHEHQVDALLAEAGYEAGYEAGPRTVSELAPPPPTVTRQGLTTAMNDG